MTKCKSREVKQFKACICKNTIRRVSKNRIKVGCQLYFQKYKIELQVEPCAGYCCSADHNVIAKTKKNCEL